MRRGDVTKLYFQRIFETEGENSITSSHGLRQSQSQVRVSPSLLVITLMALP